MSRLGFELATTPLFLDWLFNDADSIEAMLRRINVEQLVEREFVGETKLPGEDPPHCPFVHLKNP
jgi:hypothetical protein